MGDLIFEEPPTFRMGRPLGGSPFGQWLAALRDHPGQWAKFPEPRAAAVSTHVRRGDAYGVEAGEFETRTMSAGTPGRVWIYARYVGGES